MTDLFGDIGEESTDVVEETASSNVEAETVSMDEIKQDETEGDNTMDMVTEREVELGNNMSLEDITMPKVSNIETFPRRDSGDFMGLLKERRTVEFTTDAVESGTQFVSIDVGSTGIRTLVLRDTPDPSDIDIDLKSAGEMELIALDSDYALADSKISKLSVRKKDTIYDQLEMKIENHKADALFGFKHIVRGSLIGYVGVGSSKLASSASKVDQEQTYINIISNVAISLLNKELRTGIKMANTILVDLTVALPSDDLNSEEKLDKFKNNLSGNYIIEFPKLKHTIRFTITPQSITVTSEASATSLYVTKVMDVELEGDCGCGAIENVGGRSTGGILSSGYMLAEGNQIVSQTGGSALIREVGKAIASEKKLNAISTEVAEHALKTGVLVRGKTAIDVLDIVEEQKEIFAQKVFNDFLSLLDTNEKAIEDVSMIMVSGRVFNQYDREDADSLPTLVDKFARLVYSVSKDTIVGLVDTDYPIPYGLMEYRLAEV